MDPTLTYHLLNGDALADKLNQSFPLNNFIICRECLMDGVVQAPTLEAFWINRADFIAETFHLPQAEYFEKVVKELDKLASIPDHAEVCLWFENDLFCQANMWFMLSVLSTRPNLKIYRVFPIIKSKGDFWKGFGVDDTETLVLAYSSKILFQPDDIDLGQNLWKAFRNGDLSKLKSISPTPSPCFELLEEVCQAHIDRFPVGNDLPRPEKILQGIIKSKPNDFYQTFNAFSAMAGIYGFGDTQVKRMYDQLIIEAKISERDAK